MKIAITSTGAGKESPVSEKFGRCSYFVIYDTEDETTYSIVNTAVNSEHGAGPRAAQLIINENAEVVLTGAVGGNAESVLNTGKVKIITGFKSSMKITEVINQYLNKTKMDLN